MFSSGGVTLEEIFKLDTGLVATLAGVSVGGLLKIVNKLFDRRKDNLQEHLELRKELREELDAVKEEIHILQKELHEWKERYYQQLETTNSLKLDVVKLTDELEEYKRVTGNYSISELPEN